MSLQVPGSASMLKLSPEGQAARHKVKWSDLAKLILPATCSFASIVLQGAGLRFISASTSQMLCGSAILFTAALSLIFLGCRLNGLHCTGEQASISPLHRACLPPDLFSQTAGMYHSVHDTRCKSCHYLTHFFRSSSL